jgi:hypothetical protein
VVALGVLGSVKNAKPMPPIVGAVLIGAAAWAAYRAARGLLSRLQTEAAATPAPLCEKHLGTLRFDPETGVYEPSNG